MTDNLLEDDLNHILAHTKGLWEGLRGKRLFITGGTGFMGCWLLESFVWANDSLGLGAEALVLTRDPDAFCRKAPHLSGHPAVKLVHGDVCSFRFPDGNFSHIIHGAAETSAESSRQDPLKTFETILVGSRRVLDFAIECSASRFLFISSGAVYGTQPTELTHLPEDYCGAPDLAAPHSAYGEAKRAAEWLCTFYGRKHGLATTIARCFAFVGPYLPLDRHYAAGNFICDGLRGGPIRLQGDGRTYRSYLYAADLAVWLWTILLRGIPGRPYNVGSDKEVTIEALARIVARVFGPHVKTDLAINGCPDAPTPRYVPSTERARTELNLRQCFDLEESIERTKRWHARLTAGRPEKEATKTQAGGCSL